MNQRNNKEKVTERGSTSVVIIILAIVSLVLFAVGASMLFSWVSNKEMEERLQMEENQALIQVRTHYGLEATYNDGCMKLKEEGDKKYYIVVASERIFKVESYDENNYHVYNVEEIGNG